MQKKISLLLFILTTFVVVGQRPNFEDKKVFVSGKVLDESSKTPLEYATVSFFSPRQKKVIGGGITDASGNFSIEIPAGMYRITIEYISFKPKVLQKQRLINTTDLGVILLGVDTQALSDVVVIAEKTTVEIRLDKKIYNVGKDLTVSGGTVSDVLDNVPSVSVDADGTIALRGNDNVRILINGKPSGLIGLGNSDALQQLPAESIERVEVITSPSARYDAEGTAGILNIILKRNKLEGLNGAITVHTQYPLAAGISGNLNYRVGDWNFFTTSGYNYRKQPGNAFSSTEYFNPTAINTYLDETREFNRIRQGFNTNFGAEWYINKTSSITQSFLYRSNDNDNRTTNLIQDLNATRQVASSRNRFDNETETATTRQYSLNYTKDFDHKGHKLTIDFQIENSDDNEHSIITQDNLTFDEQVKTLESQDRLLLQSDYTVPIGENSQFELGYRGNFNSLDTDYFVAIEEDEVLTQNDDLSNNLIYKEYVNAAYAQYGNKKGKFSYLFGLRLESTRITIDQKTTGDFNKKNYTDLFPTINLGYQFSDNQSFTLGYNRRIRRPRARFINPFPSRSSATNLFQGNPDLDPFYSNAVELGYLNKIGKLLLNTSIYYNHATNVFSVVAAPTGTSVIIGEDANNDPILVPVIERIPVNLTSTDRYGIELITTYTPTKKWRLNGSFNGFLVQTKGNFRNQSVDAENFSWFARINNKLTLPGKIAWQTAINYFGPRINAQVERKGIFSTNMALSRDFFKEKATLVVNVRDLFNTRIRKSTSETPDFNTYSEYQRRQRTLTLAFTYRFNQKKKRERSKREGNSGEEEFEE